MLKNKLYDLVVVSAVKREGWGERGQLCQRMRQRVKHATK